MHTHTEPTDAPEGVAYILRTDDGRFIEEFLEFPSSMRHSLMRIMVLNQAREARIKNVVLAGQIVCQGEMPPAEAASGQLELHETRVPAPKHEGIARPSIWLSPWLAYSVMGGWVAILALCIGLHFAGKF